MTPTINLERNLRPFEKVSDHFYLIAPNRFMVMPSRRRGVMKGGKRVEWKYQKIGHCVIGTLMDRFDQSGKFSMDQLTFARLMRSWGDQPNDLQSLPTENIPNLDLLRSQDGAVRFELGANQVQTMKKAARLLQRILNKRSRSKLFLQISTDDQSVCLNMSTGQGAPYFENTLTADVISPFSGSISAETLKSLREEDQAVTIDAKGVVEMIGVESGLVILIPTSK